MRLLFVANRMPYPPYRGDKLKIYNLGKAFKDEHEVDLITIAESKEDIESVRELRKVFRNVEYTYIPKWRSRLNVIQAIFSKMPFQIAYFKSVKFESLLLKTLQKKKYDAIHVQHLRMSQFLNNTSRKNVILDLPDAFSLYWQRRYNSSTNSLIKLFNRIEYQRLENFEKEYLPKFPLSLVCSKEDQRYLSSINNSRVALLPNGVDTVSFAPPQTTYQRYRILFTGNMDYAPNIDAAEYFVHEIFPKILAEIPQAIFIIAGQRPVKKVQNLAADNIFITGFIPNLAEEYAKAHVVVSPLRIGAGTQNKVLEALSMNIPVVTTNVGYEGLELPPDTGALYSEDSDSFAFNVLRLLKDDDFRNKTGTDGGEIIRNRFSWPSVAKQLENYFNTLIID